MRIKLNKNNEKITVEETFIRYQKQSKIKNLSDYTIKYQNAYYEKFKKFLEVEGFLVEDIKMDIIDDCIIEMMEKGIKQNRLILL